MTGRSHATIGFASFVGMCAVDYAINGQCSMSYAELGVGGIACVIGSLAPDIDHPKSKISTEDIALSLLSKGVCTFTSHRRHTHTLVFCILMGFLAYLLALLTINKANTSTAFLIAFATFVLIHADNTSQLQKFGSIIAIAVYIACPFIMANIPLNIPTVKIPIEFAKYVGLFFGLGCVSHLIADAACKEGVPLLWPLVPMNKHFRFATITTGTLIEDIVAGAVAAITVLGVLLLFHIHYFVLPF